MIRVNPIRTLSTLIPPRVAIERALKDGTVTGEMLPKSLGHFAPWVARIYNEFAKCSGQFILHNSREYIFQYSEDDAVSPHPFIKDLWEEWSSQGGQVWDFAFMVDRAQALRSGTVEDVTKAGSFLDERA